MELSEWIAARTERLRRLGAAEIRALTPSLRDFLGATATQRGPALSVICELARATPEEGPLPPVDVDAFCQMANAASVSALAVGTDPIRGAGDDGLLAQASAAFEGPVLARDLIVSRDQLSTARLIGADAVLLTAAALPPGELKACIEISGSMHMAAPVEVGSREELALALAAGARAVVIPAFGGQALDLDLDLDLANALLALFPRNVVALVRGPFTSPAQLEPLRGRADGVWVAGPLYRGALEDFLPPFVNAAENGTP